MKNIVFGFFFLFKNLIGITKHIKLGLGPYFKLHTGVVCYVVVVFFFRGVSVSVLLFERKFKLPHEIFRLSVFFPGIIN